MIGCATFMAYDLWKQGSPATKSVVETLTKRCTLRLLRVTWAGLFDTSLQTARGFLEIDATRCYCRCIPLGFNHRYLAFPTQECLIIGQLELVDCDAQLQLPRMQL